MRCPPPCLPTTPARRQRKPGALASYHGRSPFQVQNSRGHVFHVVAMTRSPSPKPRQCGPDTGSLGRRVPHGAARPLHRPGTQPARPPSAALRRPMRTSGAAARPTLLVASSHSSAPPSASLEQRWFRPGSPEGLAAPVFAATGAVPRVRGVSHTVPDSLGGAARPVRCGARPEAEGAGSRPDQGPDAPRRCLTR